MIQVVIGTKAQLVKMAPVMMEMQAQSIDYNFVFTGQHQETMNDLRENFQLKEPDVILHSGSDITSIPKMLLWLLKLLTLTLIKQEKIFERSRKLKELTTSGVRPSNADSIVLVHGDTFSTLLGALMGRLAGVKVAHVESGLRSFNWFHPFPEELTRLAVFKLAHVYFCPGQWAVSNLSKETGAKIDTQYNTLMDSLRHAQRHQVWSKALEVPTEKYAVVTTHRFENIFRKSVFEANLDLIDLIAQKCKVLFVMHPVTLKKLKELGLLYRIEGNPNIETRPRYDYFAFMKLVAGSEFVVTDGGSNQEECFYMGKPCLLLRSATERQEGLNSNTILSEYSVDKVQWFLENYATLRGPNLVETHSPSAQIVEYLKNGKYV